MVEARELPSLKVAKFIRGKEMIAVFRITI